MIGQWTIHHASNTLGVVQGIGLDSPVYVQRCWTEWLIAHPRTEWVLRDRWGVTRATSTDPVIRYA